MPQYGAGVSFSKMKRSLGKTRAQTEEKKQRDQRRAPKSSRKKTRRQKTRRPRAQGSKTNKKKVISLHKNACQCGTHHYTGSEPTPRGLGNCEECIPLHVVLRGKDGQLYENRGNMWSLL